jgi:hypothetical protein
LVFSRSHLWQHEKAVEWIERAKKEWIERDKRDFSPPEAIPAEVEPGMS